jgi:hypothetical protein
MSDIPSRPDDRPEASPSNLGSRVQARLDDLDAGAAPSAPDRPVGPAAALARAALAPDPMWTGRPSGSPLEDVHRQLEVLRGQLDDAFDDLEQRLDDAEARASIAEARASVAESRSSAAEVRIAEAESRADDAHQRIDQLLAVLKDGGLDASPTPGRSGSDLRSALDRLRSRLDV